MYRGFIIVLIMQLGFFIHGCTTLEHIDGSSKEELKKFKMSKYEMIHEMEKVRADNINLQRQMDILNTLVKEKQRIIDEKESKIPALKGENENVLARLKEENELLSEQIRTLKSESQRMREENESRIAGLKGENENELARLKEENELLSEEIKKLKSEKQRIIDEKESKIAGLKGENENVLARLKEENELLSEQIKNLTKESQKVKYKNKSLVKMITRQKGTLLSQSHALKRYIQKLKIKVLSRDSKNAAEKMTKKLNKIGYDIKSVSYAPQSKFSRNTVYFVPEFKDDAEQLAVSLGGNTTFKPLNWPSVFDLIVVTEKNP